MDHPWFPPRRILTIPRTGPGPAGAEIAEHINTLIQGRKRMSSLNRKQEKLLVGSKEKEQVIPRLFGYGWN